MAQLTYSDKTFLNQNASIPDVNKVTDDDMNEIKSVVNENDNNVGDLSNLETTSKSSIVGAINELVPITLYNNSSGTTGNVTLSDDASNYTYLEIFFKDAENSYSSIKINNPNGKNASLNTTYITQGQIQFFAKTVSISNSTISNINGYTLLVRQSAFNGYNNSNNYILITKVLGYK